MDTALLALLKSVDTPTVFNAIEFAQGQRGYDRFTRGTVHCSDPNGGAIVGYARTAKVAGNAPSPDTPAVTRARRMDYYRHMAEAPKPSICVIEDIDGAAAIGAYWGEVNVAIHKGFGMAGALTNGVMRDLGDLDAGFPVIAGSIGVSHGFVHVREIDTPVTVFGLAITPGDLVHADRHGALIVPSDVIPHLADAIARLHATERLVLDPARRAGFDFAAFEAAWTAFENARI